MHSEELDEGTGTPIERRPGDFEKNDADARERASGDDRDSHADEYGFVDDDSHENGESESDEDGATDSESDADAADAAAAYARASMRDFERAEETPAVEGDEPLEPHRGEKPRQLVIVNDVPGDETRIAILEQGKLAQFYSERATTATNVGSIYKARVVNVEPAIQAAFVDFGEGANGFLHISDLHPKYFPGAKDQKEKVGRKIPRRARPMIQDALKRGMEITVQVLKEGLGSKGPTVTSYLSIPGRLLVMMPDMDNVGVSRKVDDDESRRKMRKILDSLELPEGFGFILRTAGFDSTRTELARDAQYLTRLWDVMEKRMHAVGAPCRLYTEGDILLRTIRDSIDASVDGIVVDSESAFERAKAFLEVVSPRTAAKVHFYNRKMPVFHAFDVERQVDLIHAREVPLPSGGALVFDQAEALVAIDVNSGRSRSARDSETNAYQTNQEAVDEIARQLRLRDLGGVVVCDLIDMRHAKHRRDIEDRFKRNLAKDRAKTTVSEIGEFGIIELTRQRMRPSLRKTHYMDCPHCGGHGEIRMPDTVASDAMRRIQFVLDMERVARVEVVCSSRVASVLLSKKRRALVELEDALSKRVDIRISEAISVDRVDIYAYDDRNADVDLDRPMKLQMPALASLPTEIESDGEETAGPAAQEQGGSRRGGRRRRRRGKPAAADATSIILSGGFDDLPDIDEDEPTVAETLARREADERDDDESEEAEGSEGAKDEGAKDDGDRRGGRRRRRRRGRGRGGREDGTTDAGSEGGAAKPVAPKAAPTPPPPPREPSDPIRVHAIAKEIELTSKEVLAKCAELGIEVKGHQSLLTGEQGDMIRKAYGKPPFDVPEPQPEPEPEPESGGSNGNGEPGEGGRRRKRRRRRRGRGGRRDGEDGAPSSEGGASAESEAEAEPSDASEDDGDDDGGNDEGSDDSSEASSDEGDGGSSGGGVGTDDGERREGGRRRRRRRGRRGGRGGEGRPDGGAREEQRGGSSGGNGKGGGRDRGRDGGRDRGREGGGRRGGESGGGEKPKPAPAPAAAAPAAPKPRSLYGGRVRKLAPGERPKGGGDE